MDLVTFSPVTWSFIVSLASEVFAPCQSESGVFCPMRKSWITTLAFPSERISAFGALTQLLQSVKLTVNASSLAIVDNHYYLLSLYLALVEVKPARDQHVAQLAGEAVSIHHEQQ